MAGFLPSGKFGTFDFVRKVSAYGKEVNAMVKQRRRKNAIDFKEFVKRGDWQESAELDALERMMRESYDHPEIFHEEWLRPLLREGLSVETAYDVLVDGTIRPN
jgi:hypothetical protein